MPSSPTIEIIARAVIRRGDSVLLCKNRQKHYLYLPGGHVETGESAPEALRRELLEETGLDCAVGDLLAIAEVRFHDGAQRRHEINLVFHVELISGATADRAAAAVPGRVDSPVFHVEHPPVPSRETDIGFEWVARNAIPDSDIRPPRLRAWLGEVLSQPAQPEQAAPDTRRPVAWLSADE